MQQIIHYNTPLWMAVLFMIAIPFPFFFIAFWAKKYAETHLKNKVFYGILIFYALYVVYIFVASHFGLFDKVALPPRVLIYTTIPYAIFLFGVVYRSKLFQSILEKSTLQSLVKLHIFRLIGVFFILLYCYNTLPKYFAFLAGMGDMITAITSVWVAHKIAQKSINAKKWALIWNTFGLLDIIITAFLANILTKISMDTGSMGVDILAQFPFCIIPAYAPPTIIFLHVAIYKKIKTISQ
ncbi:MAG: hypothetical protein KA327_03515 [Pseudarcicella sp.]|nr:hypothetical protein [Pseudarcicella sp.]